MQRVGSVVSLARETAWAAYASSVPLRPAKRNGFVCVPFATPPSCSFARTECGPGPGALARSPGPVLSFLLSATHVWKHSSLHFTRFLTLALSLSLALCFGGERLDSAFPSAPRELQRSLADGATAPALLLFFLIFEGAPTALLRGSLFCACSVFKGRTVTQLHKENHPTDVRTQLEWVKTVSIKPKPSTTPPPLHTQMEQGHRSIAGTKQRKAFQHLVRILCPRARNGEKRSGKKSYGQG